jgi:hypothetical protein
MKRKNDKREAGIAVLSVLVALLVLSAIGAGLVFMTNTETQVNYNYRSEQVAYFAAKAGMEEARDRMMATNSNSIFGILPTSVPTMNNQGVLYIINEGASAGSVAPWDTNNAYLDDELCHDGYSLPGLQNTVAADVRCTGLPNNNHSWYQTTTSTLPWNGTSAALSYKWVRIALKLNGSVQNYPVNSSGASTTQVCWNGSTEVLLNAASCQSMTPTSSPVYLVTALAVSSTGARKMVQADVAVTPSRPSGGYGLFATGTGCAILTLGGGVNTDSWDSANGGTYATTVSQTGGSVGSNGNVSMSGNGQIGGNLGANNTTMGTCPDGITVSGGAGLVTGTNPPNQYIAISPPVALPTPPAPVPAPPTGNVSMGGGGKAASLVPGTYGDIKLTGGTTLTLSPGVYNINSIALSGNSVVAISPPGQVTLNVAGSGVATPVDFTGGTLANTTGVPNNFQINYGGTGGIVLSGGSGSYLVADAPNAAVNLHGGSDIYGAVIGASVTDAGGVNFHVDRSAMIGKIPPSGNFVLISFRHVAY